MNAARRRRIDALIAALAALNDDVDAVYEEERFAYDNMPENLQQSARGEECEAAAVALEEAVNAVEEAMDSLETARNL